MKKSFYERFGKRWFDAIASVFGLILLSPFLFVTAIAVWLDSPGSPLFLQTRVGQAERTFRIIKFRTMRAAAPGNAPLITACGDARITRVGRWLRKSKVDELPQLVNVIRGDMSLVGPRPEVPKYTKLYDADQKLVFAARPGITGPAAISCVNEEELLAREDPEGYYLTVLLPAKLRLDRAYCRDIDFRGDLILICRTLGRLFDRRYEAGDLIEKTSRSTEELT